MCQAVLGTTARVHLVGLQVAMIDHLADVLLRVQTHPASRIDELLPHRWKPPEARPSG